MLKSINTVFKDPSSSTEHLTSILTSISDPSVFTERLEPDGFDLITVVTSRLPDRGPSEDSTTAKLLQTILALSWLPSTPLAPDFNGQTPVFYAARDGRLETLKVLVESFGYDPNTVDRFGQTAAFYGAREGRVEVLKYLKAQQADMSFKDKNGQSPIFYACERNQTKTVRWLVEEAGVDPESRDLMRRCPHNYATNPEIAKILKPNKKRKIAETPWIFALKEVLRVSGALGKFPELVNIRKALDYGEFANWNDFYQASKKVLAKNKDTHDYFLQISYAVGLVQVAEEQSISSS
jgi:ankyrin repeat protein